MRVVVKMQDRQTSRDTADTGRNRVSEGERLKHTQVSRRENLDGEGWRCTLGAVKSFENAE